jgi:hypothetical protein
MRHSLRTFVLRVFAALSALLVSALAAGPAGA